MGYGPLVPFWQPPGPVGCRSRFGHEGCARTRRLGRVYDATVSPDGRFAYAATRSGGALVTFARDLTPGLLRSFPRGQAAPPPAIRGAAAALAPGRSDGRWSSSSVPTAAIYTPRAPSTSSARFGVIGIAARSRRSPAAGAASARAVAGRSLRAISRRAYAATIGDLIFDPMGRHLYLSGPDRTARVLARDRRTGALREPRSRRACLAGRFADTPATRVCRRTSAFGSFLSLAMSGTGATSTSAPNRICRGRLRSFGAGRAPARSDGSVGPVVSWPAPKTTRAVSSTSPGGAVADPGRSLAGPRRPSAIRGGMVRGFPGASASLPLVAPNGGASPGPGKGRLPRRR
jgi:hypothetical protein